MIIVFCGYFGLYFCILILILWGVLKKKQQSFYNNFTEWPSIAIVVAARNESENILSCLQSLLSLDYPTDKLHIYIGDDQSTDDTYKKIKAVQQTQKNINLYSINKELPGLRGKQNVLAQVLEKVNQEYILTTDADITVHRDWAKNMVQSLILSNCAVVTGPTIVEGETFLAKMQALDWLMGVTIIFFFLKSAIQ